MKVGASVRFVPKRVHAWALGEQPTGAPRVQLPTCQGKRPERS